MIGIPCPWCDKPVAIGPEWLAAVELECQACHTRVDLAHRDAHVTPFPAATDRELRPAA